MPAVSRGTGARQSGAAVWGSDWPHPRIEGEMPDAGQLFDLFRTWTPDEAIRRQFLSPTPRISMAFRRDGSAPAVED